MSYVHACSTLELCQYISLVVRRFLPTSMCSTRSLWRVCRCFLRTFHQKALRHVCRQSCGEKEGVCSPPVELLKRGPYLQTGTDSRIELQGTTEGARCFSAEQQPRESSKICKWIFAAVITSFVVCIMLFFFFAFCRQQLCQCQFILRVEDRWISNGYIVSFVQCYCEKWAQKSHELLFRTFTSVAYEPWITWHCYYPVSVCSDMLPILICIYLCDLLY